MPTVELKHINKVVKPNGRVYYYHRRTGKRILGDYGSAEFLENYAAASRFDDPSKGKLAGLITAFRASADFRRLAPKTQRDYDRFLDMIRDEFGTMPEEALEDKRVRRVFFEWRDRLSNRPRYADYAWSVLRRLLAYGYDQGTISVNHAVRPRRLYASDRADIIWEPGQIEAFCAVAAVELRRAMAFGLFLGQRQGDLLRLGRQHYADGWFDFRQGKTGRRVRIPAHRDFRPIVEATPADQLLFLTTKTGRPWQADHFRHSWRAATRKAGLDGLHFHDLRGTSVTMLAEVGCTDQEIATITRLSLERTRAILDKYMARTRPLAMAAIRRLENANRTELQTVLQTGDLAAGEKPAK